MLDIFTSNFRFQFITSENERFSHIQVAERVLRGGCKWIQLRVKLNSASSTIKTIDKLVETAHKLKKICDKYQAHLIINDYVDVCKEVRASGVHLGREDTNINLARATLGDKDIIGGTANSFEDILRLINLGVDYIGLGPLRFTETKKNLSSILNFSGLEAVLNKRTDAMKRVYIVAIGGIILGDIPRLFGFGVNGVAISGEITRAMDPTKKVIEIIEVIESSCK